MAKIRYYHICFRVVMCYITSVQDSPLDELSTAVTGDTYLLVGNDLKVTCSLSPDFMNYTAHDISFSHQSLQADSEPRCLNVSDISDKTKAILIIRNVTIDDAGQYACYVGEKHCQKRDDIHSLKNVGYLDDVIIEYQPHNVTNFQCLVYNWNDSMNCTWQHPVKYVDWSNINVTVGYQLVLPTSDLAFKCPHESNSACMFNKEEFIFVQDYIFEVNVTNTKKSITAFQIFHVNTNKFVQPAPVKGLSSQVTEGKQGCLTLNWEDPKKFRDKFYRIHHQNVGKEHQFQVLVDNLNITTHNICGYAPYTHHNFSVESHPAPPYFGYWSDPVYTDVWTPMTAPLMGPSIANGSFITTLCSSGLRNVTVMWQEVEETARNGIIDGYLIKQGDKNVTFVKAGIYLAVIELPCHSQTQLTLFAHNKGGYSLEPSLILIPQVSFTVSRNIKDSFSVEMLKPNARSLRALWNTTKDMTDSMNYTIFWCTGPPGQTCEGQIHWSTMSGTQTEFNIPVSTNVAERHMFGISVTDFQKGITSGIFWTWCLFTRNPNHVKPIDRMDVEGGVESVKITWSPLHCSYQDRVKITSYKLKYCEVNHCDGEEIKVIDVPATESSLTVSALKANIAYNFTVQPVSYETPGEEFVPWKQAHPKSASEHRLWLLFILFICSLPVAIWIYRKIKSSKRKTYGLPRAREMLDLDRAPTQAELEISPARSIENLLHETSAVTPTNPSQENQNHMPVNQLPGGTGQAENFSKESFGNDSSINSRTHLIKSWECKNHGRGHPQLIPEDNCELIGAPAMTQHSHLKNAPVASSIPDYLQQGIPEMSQFNGGNPIEQNGCGSSNNTESGEEVSVLDGLQAPVLASSDEKPEPAYSESVPSYVRTAATCDQSQDTDAFPKEYQRQVFSAKKKKMIVSSEDIVVNHLCLEQTKRNEFMPTESDVGENTIILSPERHETAITIHSSSSSVVGQDSKPVAVGSWENAESLSSDSDTKFSSRSGSDQTHETNHSNGYISHF